MRQFRDEWLARTLEDLIGAEKLESLRADQPESEHDSLWQAAVSQGLVSDEEILDRLAKRFRLERADLSFCQPLAREIVPEMVARRFHILPLRVSESYLEIATAKTTSRLQPVAPYARSWQARM